MLRNRLEKPSMGKSIKNLSSVTVVGLDIAKNVFQVHGVDADRFLVVAKPVRRGQLLRFFASLPRCLVVTVTLRFIDATAFSGAAAAHGHRVTGSP